MTAAELAELADVTRDDMRRRLDREARTHLGMSGEEFTDLVRRGAPLPPHPVVGHLLLILGDRPA